MLTDKKIFSPSQFKKITELSNEQFKFLLSNSFLDDKYYYSWEESIYSKICKFLLENYADNINFSELILSFPKYENKLQNLKYIYGYSWFCCQSNSGIQLELCDRLINQEYLPEKLLQSHQLLIEKKLQEQKYYCMPWLMANENNNNYVESTLLFINLKKVRHELTDRFNYFFKNPIDIA